MTEDSREEEIDPFFETVHDGQWNACVGVQGSELNYVEGYLDASRILVDALVAGKMMDMRDTLVLPILYNARHGLELALKYVVAKLVTLELARLPEGRANHHILRYWQHIQDADVADLVVREIIAKLEPFVRSLSRMDVDGQQLRYFSTKDNGRSLGDQAVVHLLLIQGNIAKLAAMVGKLTKRVDLLMQEQQTGTRTTRCSRSDLIEIVKIVGPHATWVEDAFLARKSAVMSRFGLSKKAFSNALNAIKGSRELSARIGIETAQRHVNDEQVVRVAELWFEAYPPTSADAEPATILPRDISFESIEQYSRKMQRLVTSVIEELTLEEFADVETIYYIGRNKDHGEYYELNLDSTIKQHELEKSRRHEKVYHIMSKTNLLEGLIAGFRRIGRPSLAARLSEL